MEKARIDLLYPKYFSDVNSFDDFEIYYNYEDILLLSADYWDDLVFAPGSFLIQYKDQYLHIYGIDLSVFLNFLEDGLYSAVSQKAIYCPIGLSDYNNRLFLFKISYPKKGYLSISRVSDNENRIYHPSYFSGKTNRTIFSEENKLISNLKLTKTYFEVTFPIEAITEPIIASTIQHIRWKSASRNRKISDVESLYGDAIIENVSKSTGIPLKTKKHYVEEKIDRREYLEEELKWLYVTGYGSYNKNVFYKALLKDIIRKINSGGIRVYLKRFIEEHEPMLSINSLEELGAYYKHLKLINITEDLFEDKTSYYNRIREVYPLHRVNIMMKRLKEHQKTRFKRQYYHNPEGVRNSVLKRDLEKKLNKKIDKLIVYGSTIKY